MQHPEPPDNQDSQIPSLPQKTQSPSIFMKVSPCRQKLHHKFIPIEGPRKKKKDFLIDQKVSSEQGQIFIPAKLFAEVLLLSFAYRWVLFHTAEARSAPTERPSRSWCGHKFLHHGPGFSEFNQLCVSNPNRHRNFSFCVACFKQLLFLSCRYLLFWSLLTKSLWKVSISIFVFNSIQYENVSRRRWFLCLRHWTSNGFATRGSIWWTDWVSQICWCWSCDSRL